MGWSSGDDAWLLGDWGGDVDALAASELAWSRGARGGSPSLDVVGAARVVRLLPTLARDGLIGSAHDASVGGVAVALARVAIATGLGGAFVLPTRGGHPTAALFGERAGRVVVGIRPDRAQAMRDACAAGGVPATRLGAVGSDRLEIRAGPAAVAVAIEELELAWARPL
jgi:phosphoribosylformylglycinamidine synthase